MVPQVQKLVMVMLGLVKNSPSIIKDVGAAYHFKLHLTFSFTNIIYSTSPSMFYYII